MDSFQQYALKVPHLIGCQTYRGLMAMIVVMVALFMVFFVFKPGDFNDISFPCFDLQPKGTQ